jgi:hypothetical protein
MLIDYDNRLGKRSAGYSRGRTRVDECRLITAGHEAR